MTSVAAIIVGIDGWEQYTLPLIRSIEQHEPDCGYFVIDNASKEPYPYIDGMIREDERVCYSRAINYGYNAHAHAVERGEPAPDWYIVLSNDVLCTGPFIHMLAALPGNVIAGPQLWHEHGYSWLVGWAIACPAKIWNALGGWDEAYKVSSVEDVDFSTCAIEHGFALAHVPELPFVHLEQKQRFGLIPEYWKSEFNNWAYFRRKHAKVEA